jgi:hypothetical protein
MDRRIAGIKYIIHHEHGFSIEESNTTLPKRDISRFILYRIVFSLVIVCLKLRDRLFKTSIGYPEYI